MPIDRIISGSFKIPELHKRMEGNSTNAQNKILTVELPIKWLMLFSNITNPMKPKKTNAVALVQ